jgi:hypothetical protein
MRIIVPAYYEDAGVVTLSNHDQVVQVAKVLMVMREQNAMPLNGMSEMNGIVITAQTDIGRHLDVMTRLSEQLS